MKNYFFTIALLFVYFSCSDNAKENQSANKIQQDSLPAEKTYTNVFINRFDQAIHNMEVEDSSRIVQENEVLFIGSSSIRMWSSLPQDFDPIPVLNRGFGGSTLPEVIYYADRIIFPYEPELIVLYCGENDIEDGASPEQVFDAFKTLDEMIRKELTTTRLIYISMKPSVARWDFWEEYMRGNKMIREYIETREDRYYLDCSSVMLLESGEPDPSIFTEDNLHMNAKGYEAWTSLLRPLVEKLYQGN